MSTRAHIIIKEGDERRYLYRHFDGYPAGLGAELKECLFHLKTDKYTADAVADAIAESCAVEYENTGVHGDEDYIYEVDVTECRLTLTCFEIKENRKLLCRDVFDTKAK